MTNAFGQDTDAPRAWCNLCRAEGDTFEVDASQDDWLIQMHKHSNLRHPEHEAALRRGEEYVPVEVAP